MRYNQKVQLLSACCEQYEALYQQLQHELNELKRYRFGQRSERDSDPDNPQMPLFDAPVPPNAPQAQGEQITIPAHQRKKKRKQKDLSKYERVIEVIPVSEEQKQCHCGCEKRVIRYEIKALYHYIPAEFKILEQRREVMACPNGCQGGMCIAPSPKSILPKACVTESLLAHIIVAKFHHRQPLYHLEKYALAVDISRKTMARWLIQCVEPLQPLINLMKDKIIAYDVSSIDATSLQVLKEPGRSPKTKSYVYCIRGGPPDKSVIVYDYNASQHKPFVDNQLEGFKGYIHMDADPFFELLLKDEAVSPVFCHAHCRRYFEKIKQQAKKQGLAHDAIRIYKKLFRLERAAKEEQLSAEQRYHFRCEHVKPLLDEFKQWLDEHYPSVLPQSPLGKAFQYAIRHWKGLNTFLNDGRLEMTNNETEQEIKPFVVVRKNFLFANSMDGAKAICTHVSLIRTALKHKLNPYQYYVHILKQIPLCNSVEDYEKLLPWNVVFKENEE